MQLDDSKFKSFHLGTNNINVYQEWYREIEVRIDLARIDHFKEVISSENKLMLIQKEQNKEKGKIFKKLNKLGLPFSKATRVKTITELVIDKQMRQIEDCDDGLTILED